MGLRNSGQGSNDEAEVVVIGGMILDINATPSVVANPRTSTPGKVIYTLGGVGRNVAECMSKLGARPFMISAIGFDPTGSLLLEPWKAAGLSEEGIQRRQDIETAVVCNIFDSKGELAAGIACVETIEKFLTPQWIEKFKFKISSAPILMVDANLSSPALAASCKMAAECRTPVWFEPVSVIKSRRVASVAKYITFTSPNEDELIAMANALSTEDRFSPIRIDDKSVKFSIESFFQMLKPAIWVLLDNGIRVVLVTVGPHGAFLCCQAMYSTKNCSFSENRSSFSRKLYDAVNFSCPHGRILGARNHSGSSYIAVHFPALSASVVRLTGCGDCLVGGTIASYCAGLDIMQSVAVGIAAAKGAVETERTVPVEYELTKLSADAASVYSDARVVFCESKL